MSLRLRAGRLSQRHRSSLSPCLSVRSKEEKRKVTQDKNYILQTEGEKQREEISKIIFSSRQRDRNIPKLNLYVDSFYHNIYRFP